jgi:hypothetical protein
MADVWWYAVCEVLSECQDASWSWLRRKSDYHPLHLKILNLVVVSLVVKVHNAAMDRGTGGA